MCKLLHGFLLTILFKRHQNKIIKTQTFVEKIKPKKHKKKRLLKRKNYRREKNKKQPKKERLAEVLKYQLENAEGSSMSSKMKLHEESKSNRQVPNSKSSSDSTPIAKMHILTEERNCMVVQDFEHTDVFKYFRTKKT